MVPSEGRYHAIPVVEVLRRFGVDRKTGLTEREARRRLKARGRNRIPKRKRKGFLSTFFSQFCDVMVLTLLGATLISAAMGEVLDALVIACIVALNAVLGTVQEFKAEGSLEILESYVSGYSTVIRDGREQPIEKDEVVPGDIMVLTPGSRVPADGRLIESKSLQIEEAALTGESLPSTKDSTLILSGSCPVSDRKNMVYAGTLVVRGQGLAVVTATGMKTEMGKVAGLLGTAQNQKTPLEKRLEQLGAVILAICLGVSASLGIIGVFRGIPFHDMFLSAVSLAVAAIPEGLPATVTLCLAIGVQRMAKNGAVVRKLESIETLGSVTVICTDKTGTLTKNKMEVIEIGLPCDVCEINEGDKRAETVAAQPKKKEKSTMARDVRRQNQNGIVEILKVATLASDARHAPGSQLGEDPTEQAIIAKAVDAGLDVSDLDYLFPRLGERGFTPERRMMSVKVKTKEGALICAKGAPDTIIPLCRTQLVGDQERPLGRKEVEGWERWVEERAAKGMRILAVAMRSQNQEETGGSRSPLKLKRHGMTEEEDYLEKDLVLLGCLAMADPLRKEAALSVQRCKIAGIRPVLVTGDHLRTAESVAREALILDKGERGMTGAELEKVPESGLGKAVDECRVFARVSPAHKLKIVRALKKLGHVVAMTGDGINDGPALKEAAVGVAMGLSGTDVARETSSIVLTDDNFATIVRAVEEGRAIYENIRKFIRYLLSCNLGEVFTMSMAVTLGLPLPLLPIQLLWMNLVTDGLPALALSVDPPDKDLMKRPPREPGESLFSHGLWVRILGRGLYIGAATFLVFAAVLRGGDTGLASTMAFATLVTAQLAAALDCRSETKSVAQLGIFSNAYLMFACLLSWLMLFATIQFAPLATLFHTVPLSGSQWALVFALSFLPDVARGAFGQKAGRSSR